MPVNVIALPFRRLGVCSVVLALAAALALAVVLVAVARRHREPAPPGPEEARVRQLVLSDAPLEARFSGLFRYFGVP
jgi:hypothetical protein